MMIKYDNDIFSCGICKGRMVETSMCEFFYEETRLVGVKICCVSEIIGVYKIFGHDLSLADKMIYFFMGALLLDSEYQNNKDAYREAAKLFGKEWL